MDIDNWIESTRLANADTRLSPPERGIPNQHHGKKASFRSASPQSQRDRRPRVEPMPDETDPPRTYDPTKLSLSTHVRKQSGPSVLDHRVPSSRHSTNEDKQVHEPYTRRPRRKTRLDLYEPRRSDRKKRSRKRTRSANQDGPQSKNRRRKTSDILHTFHADNVKQDRLTLRPEPGIFSRGRASMPLRAQGVPDLAFSEMKFLQRPRNIQIDSAPAAEDMQPMLKEASRQSIQTPSESRERIPSARPPLQKRDVNLQSNARRIAVGNVIPVEYKHRSPIEMLPPRRSGTRLRSSRHPSQSTGPSYFTWSASPSAAAGRPVEQVKTVADLPARPYVSDDQVITHRPAGDADFPSSFVPNVTGLTSTSFSRRSEVSMSQEGLSQEGLSQDRLNRPNLRTSYGPSEPRTWPPVHQQDSSARAESILEGHHKNTTRRSVYRESRKFLTIYRDLSFLNHGGEVVDAPNRRQEQRLQDLMTERSCLDQSLHDRRDNDVFWNRHGGPAINHRQTTFRPTMYPELISDGTLAKPRQSLRHPQDVDESFVTHSSSEDRSAEQIGHINMAVYPSDGDAAAIVMPSSYQAELEDHHVSESGRRQPHEEGQPGGNDNTSEWEMRARETSVDLNRSRQTMHHPREPAMQDFWLPNRLY